MFGDGLEGIVWDGAFLRLAYCPTLTVRPPETLITLLVDRGKAIILDCSHPFCTPMVL